MDKNCGACAGCTGSCGSCTGCGSSIELTGQEIQVLELLGQMPFLPVARRGDTMDPICLEPELSGIPETTLVLSLLEKKALIDLDYRTPLKGFSYQAYGAYPCRGSMALTARGQQVLQLLELQGTQE